MSKVILKIGPETQRVSKEDINEYVIEGKPQTKIKIANDHTVIFYDRNPFYAIITDFEKYPLAYQAIVEAEKGNLEGAEYILSTILIEYTALNFKDDFSESVIHALKNSKAVALRNNK